MLTYSILARCKFKASGGKFVGIRTTQIYAQLKKSLNMLHESTSRNVLAPAINSVIFMAQRPNIAMLIVRSDSVKC